MWFLIRLNDLVNEVLLRSQKDVVETLRESEPQTTNKTNEIICLPANKVATLEKKREELPRVSFKRKKEKKNDRKPQTAKSGRHWF